jgi:hypothetical protein
VYLFVSPAKLVGLPTHMQKVTTKFLLKREPDQSAFPEDVTCHLFDVEKVSRLVKLNRFDVPILTSITQVYLYEEKRLSENISEEYSFIRKRSNMNTNGSVYGWTAVQKTRDGQVIETKRIITKREYNSLFNNRDKSRHVVRQKRISFLWNIQSFTIHVYLLPVSDICILHAQVRSSPDGTGEEVDIPPFLEVEKKLSSSEEDERFGAYHISLKE